MRYLLKICVSLYSIISCVNSCNFNVIESISNSIYDYSAMQDIIFPESNIVHSDEYRLRLLSLVYNINSAIDQISVNNQHNYIGETAESVNKYLNYSTTEEVSVNKINSVVNKINNINQISASIENLYESQEDVFDNLRIIDQDVFKNRQSTDININDKFKKFLNTLKNECEKKSFSIAAYNNVLKCLLYCSIKNNLIFAIETNKLHNNNIDKIVQCFIEEQMN